MSLLHFLRVGRSLNAEPQRLGAYQMRYRLPKFNPDEPPNALQNVKVKTQPITAGEVLPRANVTVGKQNDGALRSRAARQGDWKAFAAVVQLPGSVLQKLSKWNLFAKRPASSIFAGKQSKPANVQAELTLDKVRVLRNDLRDADLEVVPLSAARAGQRKAKVIAGAVAPREVHFNQQTEELFELQETQIH